MKTSKIATTALVTLLATGATLFATTSARAADQSAVPDIVARIAQRFSLNEHDVKTVFDEVHEEHHARMKEAVEERARIAVENGTITEQQKTAILNKLEEMKANKPERGTFSDQTPEQRKQAMEDKKAEMENWTAENGLSLETFHDIVGHAGKGSLMRHGMW